MLCYVYTVFVLLRFIPPVHSHKLAYASQSESQKCVPLTFLSKLFFCHNEAILTLGETRDTSNHYSSNKNINVYCGANKNVSSTDENREPKHYCSVNLRTCSITHAELWGMLYSLKIAFDRGYRKVLLELHYKCAVLLCQGADSDIQHHPCSSFFGQGNSRVAGLKLGCPYFSHY